MKGFKCYFLIMACGAVMSCNDDEIQIQPTPVPLLTKVQENGVTVLELIFDSQGKLIRLNDNSEINFIYYTLFDYGTEGINGSEQYTADDDALENKAVFTLDNLGRIIAIENYTSQSKFKDVASKSTFAYDGAGRVLRKQYIFENNAVEYLEEFTYNTNGHLVKDEWTYYPDQLNESIGLVTEFTPGTEAIYDNWNSFFFLLETSGVEKYVLEMFTTSSHETLFYDDGEIAKEYRVDATGQQFNSTGYLTRQILTHHNLFKKEPDIIREMTYEYAE